MKYTKEHGAPLAELVDAFVPADKFWAVLAADVVTLEDLDGLTEFCACRLAESHEECKTLTDIYFDVQGKFVEEGIERRRSLALIQQLVNVLPDGCDLSEDLFRACVYSGALTNVKPWQIPVTLETTRAHWQIYVTNDLFSVACQTLFALSLKKLQPQILSDHRLLYTVESFAADYASDPEIVKAIDSFQANTFANLCTKVASDAPVLQAWEAENHEIQIAKHLLNGWKNGESDGFMVELLLRLIATLSIRDNPQNLAYGNLAISPEALSDYPINLVSFRSRAEKWSTMSIEAMFADFISWCLNTHLRVALRKLRQTSRSTFHLRPSERGLEVVGEEIPPPAHTTPRFRQAVQILRDIGALNRDLSTPNHQTKLTSIGEKLMVAACV